MLCTSRPPSCSWKNLEIHVALPLKSHAEEAQARKKQAGSAQQPLEILDQLSGTHLSLVKPLEMLVPIDFKIM